jgi:general secretion pathway protein J
VRRERARGFTLVEVTIALTLMSFIMLGLVSAFSTLGKTATRLDEHAGKSGREWLVGEFLRATLSSSNGLLRQRLPDESEAIYFRSGQASLQWLGSMPARYGAGGLYLFYLMPEAVGKQMNLTLRFTPYVKDAEGISVPDTHTLVENLSSLNILYQNHPTHVDEDPVWNEVWDDPDKLPARIRIDIVSEGSPWPPIIIAMGAGDAGSTGGSSRRISRSHLR